MAGFQSLPLPSPCKEFAFSGDGRIIFDENTQNVIPASDTTTSTNKGTVKSELDIKARHQAASARLTRQMQEAIASSRAELQEALASSRAELQEALASSRAELQEALASSRAELQEALASSRAELQEALASSRAELQKALASSRAEQELTRQMYSRYKQHLERVGLHFTAGECRKHPINGAIYYYYIS